MIWCGAGDETIVVTGVVAAIVIVAEVVAAIVIVAEVVAVAMIVTGAAPASAARDEMAAVMTVDSTRIDATNPKRRVVPERSG